MKQNDWETNINKAKARINRSKNKKNIFISLLLNGYFPKQLPPPFSTTKFANFVASNINIVDVIKNSKFSFKDAQSAHCQYSLARPNELRRLLSIPNPMHYLLISLEIAAHWEVICKCLKNNFAASKPIFNPQTIGEQTDLQNAKRSFEFSASWEKLSEMKMEARVNSRFLIKADISKFYPSIYTHSIPWALHGKPIAKKNRGFSLLGNRLDYLFRMSQNNQTIGIPIGPDASLIISECILATIDKSFLSSFPKIKIGYIRMVDDFEISTYSREDANKLLATLIKLLKEYELELNTTKSEIMDLPFSTQPAEFLYLRLFSLNSPDASGNSNDRITDFDYELLGINGSIQYKKSILNYIDLAFEIYKKHPKGALKYSIKKIPSTSIYTDILAYFYCQCMVIEPGTIEVVLTKISESKLWNNKKLKTVFVDCFHRIIIEHAPLNHSSEVAWAIWGLMLFEAKINSEAAECICNMSDTIVLIIALDAASKGLLSKTILKNKVECHFGADKLYDKEWLLVYESIVNGWLNSGNEKIIEVDPFFKELMINKVRFYNSDSVYRYREMMKGWQPHFGYEEHLDNSE